MLRASLVLAFCCAVSSSALAQQRFSGLPGWVSTNDRTVEACDRQGVATVSLRYHISYHRDNGLSPKNTASIDAFIQAAWAQAMEEQTLELAPEQNNLGYDHPDIVQRMDEISLSTLAYKLTEPVQAMFHKAVSALSWVGEKPTIVGHVSKLERGCSL